MSSILTAVGSFITAAISWMGDFLSEIVASTTSEAGVTTLDNPVLFIFVVAVPLVGIGIGLLQRLIKTRG